MAGGPVAGVLDDTDMCDTDEVIMILMSKATVVQCRVLWMRFLELSEPVKLGCVLEKSEAMAITQFSSRAS